MGRLEMAPSWIREASLGGLGGFLEGLWRLLGRLEVNLRTRMAPSWIWEASWGGLGDFLGRLEAKLRAKMAPSWVPRGGFFGVPKRSWAVLRASWVNHLSGSSIWRPLGGGLGGLLGRLESQDGSKLGPKREVFGVPKRSENGCIIGSLLRSIFS